jgi:hypothetical protein
MFISDRAFIKRFISHADGRLIDLSGMGYTVARGAPGPTLIEPSPADRRIVKTRKKVVAGWRTALQSPQVQLVHLFRRTVHRRI